MVNGEGILLSSNFILVQGKKTAVINALNAHQDGKKLQDGGVILFSKKASMMNDMGDDQKSTFYSVCKRIVEDVRTEGKPGYVPLDKPCILTIDNTRLHSCEVALDFLAVNNILVVTVPPNSTYFLQVADVSTFNGHLKKEQPRIEACMSSLRLAGEDHALTYFDRVVAIMYAMGVVENSLGVRSAYQSVGYSSVVKGGTTFFTFNDAAKDAWLLKHKKVIKENANLNNFAMLLHDVSTHLDGKSNDQPIYAYKGTMLNVTKWMNSNTIPVRVNGLTYKSRVYKPTEYSDNHNWDTTEEALYIHADSKRSMSVRRYAKKFDTSPSSLGFSSNDFIRFVDPRTRTPWHLRR